MERPYTEDYEAQALTDPEVQEDFVLVRGKDGKMHRVEVVQEEVDGDGDTSDN